MIMGKGGNIIVARKPAARDTGMKLVPLPPN